jgi:hypothetical protein
VNGAIVARGAVVWAAVLRVPDRGFRRWRHENGETETLDAVRLARDLYQAGEASCTVLVEAALRPVVVLQDRPQGVLGDALALAVVPLGALSRAQRDSVRAQREPSLFHLPERPAKYGLNQETAIDLNGLLRLQCDALLPKLVGRLDDNEMRVIGERLVAHLDIDLEPIVTRLVEERLQLIAPAVP